MESEVSQIETLNQEIYQIFNKFKDEIHFEDLIEDHIKWLFRHFLQHPYKQQKPINGLVRPIHGISDMARVAFFGKIFLELYRYADDVEALNVDSRKQKLIQLTCAWHDAGREDDNEDRWDHVSAMMLYG